VEVLEGHLQKRFSEDSTSHVWMQWGH
jgi:hypothetical protein